MLNIAIIGVGQVGYRHFESVLSITNDVSITVVDPHKDSLDRTKDIFETRKPNARIKSVRYLRNLQQVNDRIDVAIVSTSADHRYSVINELLDRTEVNYFILEKILFQRTVDYESVLDLLNRHNSKAWVNCTRRLYNVYIQLKELFRNTTIHEMQVKGSDWGLASSTIHFIDLISYFTKCTEYSLIVDQEHSLWRDSKRPGIKELMGHISVRFNNGTYLNLSSYKDGTIPIIIELVSDDAIVLIDERHEIIHISLKADNWEWKIRECRIPLQKDLTAKVIEDIVDTGDCLLTPIKESIELHLPMMKVLSQQSNKDLDQSIVSECPIT